MQILITLIKTNLFMNETRAVLPAIRNNLFFPQDLKWQNIMVIF